MIFLAAIGALAATVLLALVRAFMGPTIFDRVLAVNMIGTLTVLLIGAIGFFTERPDFLDIALAYTLINFVGTIAFLRYIRRNRQRLAPHDRAGAMDKK